MNGIKILLRAVQDGILLGSDTFANVDPEDILTDRDDRAFGERWMQVYEQVKEAGLSESEDVGLLQLREKAFRRSYQYCPDCDLSGDISDDFEIIGKGIVANLEDGFLTGLLESYIKGQIPHTIVVPAPGVSLRSLVDSLE